MDCRKYEKMQLITDEIFSFFFISLHIVFLILLAVIYFIYFIHLLAIFSSIILPSQRKEVDPFL